MGLDVYLKLIPNQEEYSRKYQEYNDKTGKLCESIFGPGMDGYRTASEEKKNAYRDGCREIEKELGLTEYGGNAEEQTVVDKSDKYPTHYFNKGYLRSSYNNGGFNSVTRSLIGKDLYDIFEPNDEYEFRPDWDACLVRAKNFVTELKAKIEEVGNTGVMFIDNFHEADGIQSAEDAMAAWQEDLSRPGMTGDYDYSNSVGHFFPTGDLKVKAFIHGVGTVGKGVYVIYEKSQDSMDFYVQGAEIVVEMCEFACNHPRRNELYMHWSS